MDSKEITLIVNQVESGDPEASAKLFQLVYGQLKDIAARQMRTEKLDLGATGLVHEDVKTVARWAQSWTSWHT